MQGVYIIAFSCKSIANFLGIGLGASEYDSINTRVKVNDSFQSFVAMLRSGYIILMIDTGIGRIHFSHGNFHGLFHVLFTHLSNFGWHGSTKKPGTFAGWSIFKYKLYIFLKAHIQHLICFIQYNVLNFI